MALSQSLPPSDTAYHSTKTVTLDTFLYGILTVHL
jgi:hypothetical protein